jgi:polysaccharide deacetylase family protein (PEP-CTERM system associated)
LLNFKIFPQGQDLKKKYAILLTFDVEDWFQVENFKNYIEFSTWNSFELRVERNILKILDILDSFSFKPKATFFILGWIAERLPDLIREIHQRGHEIASHGFNHRLATTMNENDLLIDLRTSKNFLEAIINDKIFGYRAPSFAINDGILSIIEQAGYVYDSSYNSFSAHGRYGKIDLSDAKQRNAVYQFNNRFFEIPVSNLEVKKAIVPLGGGGYFRLFPSFLFNLSMKFVLKKNKAFVFYTHPWEFDPLQPRVDQASCGFKFRHYINLDKTETKLKRLIDSFSTHRFVTCSGYLREQGVMSLV